MAAKNVVVIGSGTGTQRLLRGLKRYNVRLTALIATFDASRWAGGLGEEDAVRPADELRSSLLALGADAATTQIMERLFAYRVSGSGAVGGLSFGHLFLRALTEIMGTTDAAWQAATQVLNVQGQVWPLTRQGQRLVADLQDGREVMVETPGALRGVAADGGLRGVRPAQPARVHEGAIQALYEADIVVLGPADLHFNVAGPLQLDEVRAALSASPAVKIFVCNLMTEPYVTAGWACSRFIRQVLSYAGGAGSLDYAIINSAPLDAEALEEEAVRGAQPVALDLEECLALGLDIIVRPVAAVDSLRHDGEKLARTILFLGGERAQRRVERAGMVSTPAPRPILAPALVLSPQGAKS